MRSGVQENKKLLVFCTERHSLSCIRPKQEMIIIKIMYSKNDALQKVLEWIEKGHFKGGRALSRKDPDLYASILQYYGDFGRALCEAAVIQRERFSTPDLSVLKTSTLDTMINTWKANSDIRPHMIQSKQGALYWNILVGFENYAGLCRAMVDSELKRLQREGLVLRERELQQHGLGKLYWLIQQAYGTLPIALKANGIAVPQRTTGVNQFPKFNLTEVYGKERILDAGFEEEDFEEMAPNKENVLGKEILIYLRKNKQFHRIEDVLHYKPNQILRARRGTSLLNGVFVIQDWIRSYIYIHEDYIEKLPKSKLKLQYD